MPLLLCALATAPADAQKDETNAIGMKLARIPAGEFVMGSAEAAPKSREEWDRYDWDEAPARKIMKTADGKRLDRPVAVGSYAANPWGLQNMTGNVPEWCLDWYGPYDAGDRVDPVGRADGWARVTRGWSFLSASHKLGAVRYCRSANRSGQRPEDLNRLTGFRVVIGEMPNTKPLPAEEVPAHQRDVKQGPPPKDGPDLAKPYFADLSKGLAPPKDLWGPIYSYWNHFGTIAICPNGDVLAVWYTCTQEEGRECAQAASRLRAGSDK
jgi:hypothetical protein